MDRKHCSGCRNNFYNGNNPLGVKECWSLKDAKLVSRIGLGFWENPPYKGKKKVRVPDCWMGEGSNRTIYIKPEVLTKDGYWRS
jgi:hypothetical protein